MDLLGRAHDGADALQEGCFLIDFKRAPRTAIPVRIWFGQPIDPDTGDEMDRSPRWQIELAGVPFEHEPLCFAGITFDHHSDFWPACSATPIDQAEYDFRIARQDWAQANDPNDPFAMPGARIDPFTVTLPFGD